MVRVRETEKERQDKNERMCGHARAEMKPETASASVAGHRGSSCRLLSGHIGGAGSMDPALVGAVSLGHPWALGQTKQCG
jgi:hypothetical protein